MATTWSFCIMTPDFLYHPFYEAVRFFRLRGKFGGQNQFFENYWVWSEVKGLILYSLRGCRVGLAVRCCVLTNFLDENAFCLEDEAA